MVQQSVLIVDDEKSIRNAVRLVFEREGMAVKTAASGQQALEILEQQQFNLIILDVMLGDLDGFYIISLIRKKEIHTPVLFLSGNQEEQSKILGISLGGDDYLTKPFNMTLLLTKAQALMRRQQQYDKQSSRQLGYRELKLDLSTYEVYKGREKISLTSKEFLLLKFFMEHPGQVFSKEQLYENVWNYDAVDDNTIMVYIKRLRDKIEDDPKSPQYLQTVWGLGYRLGSGKEHLS